jgi:hypothetical protein
VGISGFGHRFFSGALARRLWMWAALTGIQLKCLLVWVMRFVGLMCQSGEFGKRKRTRGNFVVCDAQASLPFKAESFDLVTCFDVLKHLPFPEKAIRNMLESCSCALICTTPNRNVERPVRKILRDFDETHVSAKSPSEWEKSIREVTSHELVKVEAFFDVTAKLANTSVLFKSVKLPRLGLTVRI